MKDSCYCSTKNAFNFVPTPLWVFYIRHGCLLKKRNYVVLHASWDQGTCKNKLNHCSTLCCSNIFICNQVKFLVVRNHVYIRYPASSLCTRECAKAFWAVLGQIELACPLSEEPIWMQNICGSKGVTSNFFFFVQSNKDLRSCMLYSGLFWKEVFPCILFRYASFHNSSCNCVKRLL